MDSEEVSQQDGGEVVSHRIGSGAPLESVTRMQNSAPSTDFDIETVSTKMIAFPSNFQRKRLPNDLVNVEVVRASDSEFGEVSLCSFLCVCDAPCARGDGTGGPLCSYLRASGPSRVVVVPIPISPTTLS